MKMRRLISILWLAAALSGADPDIRELFERARMLAEQNQNLTEAIRLYGQVVQLARAQRALAAQAQYRQGLLYQRLGRKAEAERALRTVIRDFADQAAVVRLARARLPSGGPAPEMRARRVWAGDDIDTLGSPSPDGRLFSFTDPATGNLSVHDLATGENRPLIRRWTIKVLPSLRSNKICLPRR